MSRRRKTLSHAEIDDFLSDISITTDYTPDNAAKVLGNSGKQAILGNEENMPNFDNSTSSQYISAEKNAFGMSSNKCEREGLLIVTKSQAPEDYIREYCKKNTTSNKIKVCELGKIVLEQTKYKLLPSRYTHPELYLHPSSSIESKRALLLSLSPMLTNGENQRIKDVKACTDYTRCVVEKSKKRNASYEYLDIDTNDKIEYNEYERRYLLFVSRKGDFVDPSENYKDHDQLIGIAPSLTPTEDLHLFEAEVPYLFIEDDKISVEDQEQCPKEKALKRRATLSPASARQMMLKAVDEEAFKEEEVPTTVGGSAAAAAQSMTEDDMIVAQLGVELDAMFADEDDCVVSKLAPFPKVSDNVMIRATNEVEVEECVTDEPAISSDSEMVVKYLSHVIPPDDDLATQIQIQPQASSIEENILKSTDDFEACAFMRLFVRFEQARWKYQWEICSHELKRRMSTL